VEVQADTGKCEINEAREYIKVLHLGIGSDCLVDNIRSIGPRVFASNRVCSSGVGRGGVLRLHPTNSCRLKTQTCCG